MGNLVSDAILDRVKDQGVTIVFTERRRPARLDRPGRRDHGRSADRAAVPEHAGDVPDCRQGHRRLAWRAASARSRKARAASRRSRASNIPSTNRSRRMRAASSRCEVMDGGAWKPIDPAKLYTVATNNFVRGGGDGYKLFADNAKNAYDFGPGLEQVVADYLDAHRPYTPKLEGRITEIAAAAPAAPLSRQSPPNLQPQHLHRQQLPSRPRRLRRPAPTTSPPRRRPSHPARMSQPRLLQLNPQSRPPSPLRPPRRRLRRQRNPHRHRRPPLLRVTTSSNAATRCWGSPRSCYGDGIRAGRQIADANPAIKARRPAYRLATLKIPAAKRLRPRLESKPARRRRAGFS